MDSLLTPTTALLYSYLELDAFETPGPSRKDTPSNQDVFSHAFEKYNSVYLEAGASERETLAEHDKKVALEDDVGGVAVRQYVTPPRTNEFSNPGTRNCSIDSAQPFAIPPSPITTIEQILDSPKDQELFGSFSDHWPQANTSEVGSNWQINHQLEGIFGLSEHDNTAIRQDTWMGTSTLVPPESNNGHTVSILQPDRFKRRRHHKRKPLTDEAKAIKHAKFLERNRIAADNCRKRKKVRNASLEERGMILAFRNTELKEMKDELVSEVQRLKRELDAMVNDRAENINEQVIHMDSQVIQMDEQAIQMEEQVIQMDEQMMQSDDQVFETGEGTTQADEQILQTDEQPIQKDSQGIQMDDLLVPKDEPSKASSET